MTIRETMQALLDGKKVRLENWAEDKYLFMDGDLLKEMSEGISRDSLLVPWEVYNPKVDFQTALEHMKNGGKARSNSFDEYYVVNGEFNSKNSSSARTSLYLSEIEGEWELL